MLKELRQDAAQCAALLTAGMTLALAASCCPDDPELRHGDPRPPCRYSPDPARVPHVAAPIVTAADWSEPVMLAAPVTDACPNDAVEISPDGRTIYFFWSPTVNGTSQDLLHVYTGTYSAERINDDPGAFSTPRFYDLRKCAPGGSADGRTSFTPDGDFVYFHSTRAANLGYQHIPPTDDYLDIYAAPVNNGEPGKARNLGEPVNSIYIDGEHALSPDGSRLFLASNRPGGQGGVDLWVSQKEGADWEAPVNLGEQINTAHAELQPGFAADDPDTMYFVSDRDGPSSIYRSTYNDGTWSEPEMVLTGYVGEPTLTADSGILYFVHVLVDDTGVFGSNIWYVQRLD